MLSFLSLCGILANHNKMLQFLREHSLLKKHKYCDNCEVWMSQVQDRSKVDKYIWRCPQCKAKASIRQKSFWAEQTLGLNVYLAVLYMFCADVPGKVALKMLNPTGLDGDISENTLYNWYNLYRDLMSRHLLDNPVQLGINEVVEIDESKWGHKRKYNRGHIQNMDAPWVFGMLGRTSGKVVIFTVDRRSADVLIPKIEAHVAPGATIFSYDWRAYHRLPRHGYDHQIVVHKYNFVDPITGVHTNSIEGFWGNAKNPFKAKHGVLAHQLNAHLDETMFRWNKKGENMFEVMMELIGQYYDVSDMPVPQVVPPAEIRYNYHEE